ncbi:serine phosphatase RsbU (regulator of sigma subunit)/anti-sigma regulatory factor (Ser/Thr protein kinase) [Streptomyces achromogenes]|uniref:Serine phosphatase RsbU (Regulator of sigma subunit)/anti-sigma regulatory factor (Ser/Thr protein kinase) n=1 Tax=Streptomyces achromogenes TaxID=67255 RepID=A0ABU0PZG5_STRAH|nr:SpoIIE family protein phosphatase [Streptomyces achromogenes]MDQ0683802.1 serine phosphatase RsbU (regulator of sigma subunit)/anti-sigma regulatory factor (Ser/Thr protein kinase) [Streptomyces achromogenes]
MGAIPTQRETFSRAGGAPARASGLSHTRAILAGSSLAPATARDLVRAALSEWAGTGLPGAVKLRERLAEDAILVVSELVTNAVVHAGTEVELVCRLEAESGPSDGGLAVVVEVCDRHPSRTPRDHAPDPLQGTPEHGRGLRLVATLADAWGVTYRRGAKTVWARLLPAAESAEPGFAGVGAAPAAEEVGLPGDGVGRTGDADGVLGPECDDGHGHVGDHSPHHDHDDDHDDGHGHGYGYGHADFTGLLDAFAPEPESNGRGDPNWLNRGALSFLAEASDLLAGQLDEDLVAALTGQLLVPRLADWCAVWLEDEVSGRGDWTGGPGPRLARVWHGSENRIEELRRALEKDPPCPPDGGPRSGPEPYPWPATALGPHGASLAYRLIAGGRPLGTLVLGRAGPGVFPDEVTGLVEDLGRRVALAIGAARQYARQATISAVLQRGLLPGAVAQIPGVCSALVYEPREQGGPSGDFYDLFPAGDGRWCFAVGDVQGKGPEAAVVIGLARPWLRLLAREGYGVADVLDRLNQLLLDDATEAADAAARAFVGPAGPGDGPQTRFLSLLYGELAPFEGGIRCTLASAGHPLPLLLGPDGAVATAGRPQTLLGVVEDVVYTCDSLELRPGDSLLCVTDGVTERRSGPRQFDDEDGLATALAGCAGLDAELIAERIRHLVHEFGEEPPDDDLALLVLQAE